jgi:GR25 family glycosyltransferase involved in LPS biosynthesis
MDRETYEYLIPIAIVIIICILSYLYSNRRINIHDILDNHYYINLDHRKDRNESAIHELSKIGIHNPNRFSAIKHKKGSIGCHISHLEVLKSARDRNIPYVTIFEDDILFLEPKETLEKLDRIVNSDIEWDVILLGGNNYPPYQKINEDCIKVNNCQTTTAYIVKQSYYDTLINHWQKGLDKLIETNDHRKYALDQYWKILQKKDNFILITPINVVQKESYSDIERTNVNYVDMMKNIK